MATYALLTFHIKPGHIPQFLEASLKTIPVQEKHGTTRIGTFTNQRGGITALYSFESLAAFETVNAAIAADPDFQAASTAVTATLSAPAEFELLTPTPTSNLK